MEANRNHGNSIAAAGRNQAFVIAAIWGAVGCLEAAINELFADAKDNRVARLEPLGDAATHLLAGMYDLVVNKRCSTLDKYEYALHLAGRRSFDHGARPYQDVADLLVLRNAISHYVPKTSPAGESIAEPCSRHRLEQMFAARSLTNNPFAGEGNPFYPDKLLGHGCAQWATVSTVAFVDEFFCRLDMKAPYDHVRGELMTDEPAG